MKKVLIISPNFPPVNAADMHRVRQSLPYFSKMGWKATVVAVEPEYVEMGKDPYLLETIPEDTEIIRLKALKPGLTRPIGFGNLGLRALWYLYKWGEREFLKRNFDLVYFSTTAFPVMVLGRYWKQKYNVPFIIDMQDPWRNDYYLGVPKSERPPKFRMAYAMDKWMEGWTMQKVDGIVSVSSAYPEILKKRYANIDDEKSSVIPFGGARIDFEVFDRISPGNSIFTKDSRQINIVYVGRGGHDMAFAVKGFFEAIRKGLKDHPSSYSKIRVHFVGTSYARDGKGVKTIQPIAEEMGVGDLVKEYTDRVPYFEALNLLKQADLLFVPGSMDNQYTASKLYPYILAQRPLLAAFHEDSSVVDIVNKTNAGSVVTFSEDTKAADLGLRLCMALDKMIEKLPGGPEVNWEAFEPYSAKEMTRKQVELFNKVVS